MVTIRWISLNAMRRLLCGSVIFASLIGVASCCQSIVQKGENLVDNSTFSPSEPGWTALWSRHQGSAISSFIDGHTGKPGAYLINHDGTSDWALSQRRKINVQPGTIYALSAWAKVADSDSALGFVARDASGKVLDWNFARLPIGSANWSQIRRQFVIPPDCASVQLRVSGTRRGKTWLESPSLIEIGKARPAHLPPTTISNKILSLRIASDGAMTATSKEGKMWHFRPFGPTIELRSINQTSSKSATVSANEINSDLKLTLKLALPADSAEVLLSWEGSGPMVDPMAALGRLQTAENERIVLPINEGIQYPVNDDSVRETVLDTFNPCDLSMPWFGVYRPAGEGAMALIESADDAQIAMVRDQSRLTIEPRWVPSRQAFGYARRLRLCFFNRGGYVAMAKRYRKFAQANGQVRTLREKLADNPNIDRLIGAVNIWNWNTDKLGLCLEMQQMGFDRVLWSNGGTPKEIEGIAGLGYLPGKYDLYQDVWDPQLQAKGLTTEGWPQDLVWSANGLWTYGFVRKLSESGTVKKKYQGGIICSAPGLERAKNRIPADLATHPYLARFLDTTTAAPFHECYNPSHPMTRTQDREAKLALLKFCAKDEKLVLGSETGFASSVPYVNYFEGMMSLAPYRLTTPTLLDYAKPTDDFLKYQVSPVYRLPLWELVFHDCVVSQWWWGDANNKVPEVWDQRDLLNILYGTAPMLVFNGKTWNSQKNRMLQTYQNVARWNRTIGYDELVTHEIMTSDGMVQRTSWSSGRVMTVNFGDKPYQTIPPHSYRESSRPKP
jgi:Glycosyl hydrolases related to GH101 family, GH129